MSSKFISLDVEGLGFQYKLEGLLYFIPIRVSNAAAASSTSETFDFLSSSLSFVAVGDDGDNGHDGRW